MKEAILRYMKKLDHKGRLLLPKVILKKINCNDFYVELYDDYIKLIPIKNQIGGNQ